ncbi:MAG: hypothetical protein KAY65_02545 [Planctomycetes bacterium]|nr:hypothetical protein [Planctomycetota bacterium]
MEADSGSDLRSAQGVFVKDNYHYKRTKIVLNPDHNKLGSFDDPLENPSNDPELTNGTRVLKNYLPIEYIWQDGQVVDENGRVVIDSGSKKSTDSGVSKPKSRNERPPTVLDLLRKYAANQAKLAKAQTKQRVVRFPADRSLGKLMIQEENAKRNIGSFIYWTQSGDPEWDYLGQARGSIAVPAGKRLALYVSRDAWKNLSPLSNLKPDDLYMLTIYGSYTGGPLPDDRCMPHIAHLTGLKVLKLENTRISAKGVQSLKHLKDLERLALSKRATDQALAELAELPLLKALYLKEHRLTNAGFTHLQKLTGLEELVLGGGRMNNAALAHLAKLPSLTYLLLQGDNFTDAGMAHLKNVPSLKILHLGHLPGLTNAAFVHLSEIPNLERLDLHWNENITDSGIAHLKKLGNLKKLDIRHSKATVGGVAHLSQIKTLDHLELPGKILNDEVLEYLGQLPNLRELRITRSHYVDPKMDKDYYTDRGLRALPRLSLLEDLSIGSIGVTDAGMSHIAKLTNLKRLHLFGCSAITDDGLANLMTLKSLTRLTLSYTEVTISGLTQLGALPNLTDLTVRRIHRGNSILDLSDLTNLEKLSLTFHRRSEDSFGDADLAGLSKLKRLKWLQIGPRQYTGQGLAHLAGLTEMERLGIGGPELTDDGLRHLANMKKLNHLTIIDGNITDDGLRHLEALKALGYLNITSKNRITAAAKRRLRDKLPDLAFFQTQFKKDSPRTSKTRN